MIQLLKNDGQHSNEITGNVIIPISERNRDYTPVISDVKYNAKWNISSLNIDDKIELEIDSVKYWLGYVKGIKKNWQQRVYNVLVRSGLENLQKIKVEFSALQPLINNTASFSDILVIDTWSGDTVTENGHGLIDNQRVQVKPQSGSSLPTNLSENVYYYISVVDANNFKLSETIGGLAPINLSGGSGIWEIAKDIDLTKYNDFDDESSPNANLEWILKKMFEAAGYTLDTSNLTTDLTSYVMDTNIMYAINQDVAGFHTIWDSNEWVKELEANRQVNKITCFEFLGYILSWIGASVRYKGGLEYELRQDVGTISADPEYNYDEETIVQELGKYYVDEIYSGNSSSPDRTDYQSTTAVEIDTVFTTLTEVRNKKIDFPTNFVIYNRTGGNQVGAKLGITTLATNFIIAKERQFTKETFITDTQTSIYNFRKNAINLDLGQSDIIQETYV